MGFDLFALWMVHFHRVRLNVSVAYVGLDFSAYAVATRATQHVFEKLNFRGADFLMFEHESEPFHSKLFINNFRWWKRDTRHPKVAFVFNTEMIVNDSHYI